MGRILRQQSMQQRRAGAKRRHKKDRGGEADLANGRVACEVALHAQALDQRLDQQLLRTPSSNEVQGAGRALQTLAEGRQTWRIEYCRIPGACLPGRRFDQGRNRKQSAPFSSVTRRHWIPVENESRSDSVLQGADGALLCRRGSSSGRTSWSRRSSAPRFARTKF